jgi:hypothetical protein
MPMHLGKNRIHQHTQQRYLKLVFLCIRIIFIFSFKFASRLKPYIQPLCSLPPSPMDDQAKKLHDHGNEEFKRSNFIAARDAYTSLLSYICSAGVRPDLGYLGTILSNRAAVYLKLGLPELAWSDAAYSLHLDAANIKAAYRLSMCYYEMGFPKLAKALLGTHLTQGKASNGTGNSLNSTTTTTNNAELDTMAVLMKLCSSSGATLPQDILAQATAAGIDPAESVLAICYRDYAWENKKKNKLSLRMIRQELFGDCESVCLQQLDSVGRGLVAKRNMRLGEVVFEARPGITAFGRGFQCQCCLADYRALAGAGPVFACPKCKECFCSLACYREAVDNWHGVLCGKSLKELASLNDSFPIYARSSMMLLKCFAIARQKNISPLEIPQIRYLKRIKESAICGLLDNDLSPVSFHIPSRFADAYRMAIEILGIKFDVKFDWWVWLTLHRILVLNVIPYENEYKWLVPGFCMVNHSGRANVAFEEVPVIPRRFRLVVKRPVQKGEELCAAYVSYSSEEERVKALLRYGIVQQ